MQSVWQRVLFAVSVTLVTIAASPQSDALEPDWSGVAAELISFRELPDDIQRSFVHRVVERAGESAIATGYLVGEFERREEIRLRVFREFEAICEASGGTIRHPGEAGYIATKRLLTGRRLNIVLQDRQRNGAGMLICDRDERTLGAMIAAHEVRGRSSITLLDPAIVIPDKVAEAERRAVFEERSRLRREWQQSVSEGEMTGCGRILTAKPNIVEIADRRTGQARWVERSQLNQPHEGCSW